MKTHVLLNQYFRFRIILVLLLLLKSIAAMSQATLPINRTDWNSSPTGWSTNVSGYYSSSANTCTNNNSGKLESPNDFHSVEFSDYPKELTFSAKKLNNYDGLLVVLVYTSTNNSYVLASYDQNSLTAWCTSYSKLLAWDVRKVEFKIWNSTQGEICIDDVIITQNPIFEEKISNGSNYPLLAASDGTMEWGDMDNDHYLDLVYVGATQSTYQYLTIQINNSSGAFFTEYTTTIPNLKEGSLNLVDYDNDNDLDIFISGYTDYTQSIFHSQLYENQGSLNFRFKQEFQSMKDSRSAWGDYDNDGDLDLLLAGENWTNHYTETIIYENVDGESFVETDIYLQGIRSGHVSWVDYNNDGFQDIFISGFLTSSLSSPLICRLYKNNGDNSFSEQVGILDNLYMSASTAAHFDWGDYDSDGDMDLLGPAQIGHIFENDFPNNSFTKKLISPIGYGDKSCSAWGDYDNDGDLDIIYSCRTFYDAHTYFYKNENGYFSLLPQSSNIIQVLEGSVKWADYDDDGDLDFAILGKNIFTGQYWTKIYENVLNVSPQHNQPASPTNLSATINGNIVSLSWDNSTNDYTNSIYIHEKNNSSNNILVSNSDHTSGKRTIAKFGAFHDKTLTNTYTLTKVPPGTYKWSVQSVDQGFMGSQFATEQEFEVHEFGLELNTGIVSVEKGSVDWGDCDNDGDLDLLITGLYGTNGVTKVYINDGNGVFDDLATINTNFTIDQVYNSKAVWFDFNNDNKLDIVLIGNIGGSLVSKVYRNDGIGNSTPFSQFISLTGVENGSISCGDFDNDGFSDILITGDDGVSTNPVTLLYQYDNISNTYTGVTTSISQVWKSDSKWLDFNNDGYLDLMICGATSKNSSNYSPVIELYVNNKNGFSSPISFTGLYDASVTTGDYNSDGYIDVVVSGTDGSNNYTKYLQNGSSGFSVVTNNIAFQNVSKGSLISGDVDNDGDLDVVLSGTDGSSHYCYLYLNDNGSFPANSPMAFNGIYNSSAALGDYNNDGHLDLILMGSDGSTQTTALYYNQYLTENEEPEIPTNLSTDINGNDITFYWNPSTDDHTPQDGLTYNLYVYQLTPDDGYFKSPNAFPYGDQLNGKRLVSMIGDIQYNSNGYEMNLPNGSYYWSVQAVDNSLLGSEFSENEQFAILSFTKQTFNNPALSGTYYGNTDFGDYDNDGDLDIIVASGEFGGVLGGYTNLYENLGNNTFSEINQTNQELENLGWGYTDFIDYNNDGLLDIMLTGIDGNGVSHTKLYYQDPTNIGHFVFDPQSLLDTYFDFAWGDYDNDGSLDVVIMGFTNAKIYANDGLGQFTETFTFSFQGLHVAWGDMDNDGDLDLILTSSSNTKLYLNEGNQFILQNQVSLPGAVVGSLELGDYDNDGDMDILLGGWGSNNYYSKIYKNVNCEFYELTNISIDPINHGNLSWGDFDNDGDLDVLLTGNYSNWYSKIYQNQGNDKFVEWSSNFLDTDVGYGKWGDYDNDGDLDILLINGNISSSSIYRNDLISVAGTPTTLNNKASAPSNLSVDNTIEHTIFKWDKVDGDETTKYGMSYNLYLYEDVPSNTNYIVAPDAFDANSSSNGKRKISSFGNIQRSDDGYPLDILKPGDYKWSVQAVDGGLQGGDFQTEQSFTVYNFNEESKVGLLDKLAYSSSDWGDMDNDGDLDLLICGVTEGSNYLTVIYENIGNNQFEKRNNLGDFPGIKNGSVKWGDMDNDGDLDFVISGSGMQNPFSRIYFNGGDKTFFNYVDLSYKYEDCSISLGDYDNDGDLDILICGKNDVLGLKTSVYVNEDGTFVEDNSLSLTGVYSGSVNWGDYDSDGDLDILLNGKIDISSHIYTTKIFENSRVNNDVVFTSSISFPEPSEGKTKWIDIDNDNDLDIVMSRVFDNAYVDYYTKVYRNNSNTFVEVGSFYDLNFGDFCCGDYDNDGYEDIVISGEYTSSNSEIKTFFYRNDHQCSFVNQIAMELPGIVSGDISMSDCDNDGDLDLLVTGVEAYYLLDIELAPTVIYVNNSQQYVQPAVPTNLLSTVDPNNNYEVTLSWDKPLDGLTYNIYLYQNTRDEYNSSQSSFPPGCQDDGLRLIASVGSIQYPQNGYKFYDLPCGEYLWSVQSVDQAYNGSRFAPIESFYIDEFKEQSTSLPQLTYSSVAWGDYDNDEDLDLLISGIDIQGNPISAVYENISGSFSLFQDLGTSPQTPLYLGKVAWSDYNNDGYLDALVTGTNGTTPYTYLYVYDNSSSTFIFPTTSPFTTNPNIYLNGCAWFDYNNDGDLDIMLNGNDGSGLTTLLYDLDNGSYNDQTPALTSVENGAVESGDYDNDGDLDIFVCGYDNSANVSQLWDNANGIFSNSNQSFTGVTNGDVAWGDYDNDGDLDLALVGDNNGNYITEIYKNNSGSFSSEFILLGVKASSVAWGDYDNDGDLDLLIAGESQNNNIITRIYKNDLQNNSFVEQAIIDLEGVAHGDVAWGDYDGDNDLDIILTGSSTVSVGPITKIYENRTEFKNHKCEAPVPINVDLSVPGKVTFNWDAPNNSDETNVTGLTYNIYVHPDPITSPLSYTRPPKSFNYNTSQNGLRTVAEIGYIQYGASGSGTYTLNLSAGDYIWSIQAIDAGLQGGEFANDYAFTRNNKNKFSIPYSIIAYSNIEDAGIVSGGGYFEHGAQALLKAESYSDFEFLYWKENDSIISTQEILSITVEKDRNIIAVFKKTGEFNNSFDVYPNPSDGIVYVSSGENSFLKITDISGKVVLLKEIAKGKNKIDLKAFSKGIYMFYLGNENNATCFRIILSK